MADSESSLDHTLARLQSLLGPTELLTDAHCLAVYGADIAGALQPPLAVLRPSSQARLIEAAKVCLQARIPIYPRGGGASYTHAHVPAVAGAVVLDTGALDTLCVIDETNMTVTVEAGVTWQALDQALAEKNLRTPFWGPYSGLKSTIGGSLSQHAISLGSGLYDSSASIVTGLKVLTGNGDIIDTGTTADRFYRTYGPDLSGLFLGDSGAFGIKLQATLRLIKRPQFIQASCVIYRSFEDMAQAMMEAARENLASEIMAIDPQLQQGQLGTVDVNAALETAKVIFRSSPGVLTGAKAVLGAALGSRALLRSPGYLVNYICEGRSAIEAKAKLTTLRKIVSRYGAEVVNTLSLALRAQPFRPFTPVLGPKGERWLPMHCVLPFGQVQACHDALSSLYQRSEAEMTLHKVHIATMFVTVGSNGFVYEPTFYWQDSQHEVHRAMVPEEHRSKLPVYPENLPGRELVKTLKRQIIDIMQDHGATHYQLGKSYPYLSTREPGSKALLLALKAQFDPHNLLNPGALEFPATGSST